MVTDTLANTTRAAHDLGLAAWLGGAMSGSSRTARAATDLEPTERGAVANIDHSRPPLRRAAMRSSNGNGVSPLTVAAAASSKSLPRRPNAATTSRPRFAGAAAVRRSVPARRALSQSGWIPSQ